MRHMTQRREPSRRAQQPAQPAVHSAGAASSQNAAMLNAP